MVLVAMNRVNEWHDMRFMYYILYLFGICRRATIVSIGTAGAVPVFVLWCAPCCTTVRYATVRVLCGNEDMVSNLSLKTIHVSPFIADD